MENKQQPFYCQHKHENEGQCYKQCGYCKMVDAEQPKEDAELEAEKLYPFISENAYNLETDKGVDDYNAMVTRIMEKRKEHIKKYSRQGEDEKVAPEDSIAYRNLEHYAKGMESHNRNLKERISQLEAQLKSAHETGDKYYGELMQAYKTINQLEAQQGDKKNFL